MYMTYFSYLVSLFLKRVFLVKCNVAMLRLTPALAFMLLPLALTRLLAFHKREQAPPSVLAPTLDAFILCTFPLAWFYAFLYYTEVPSLLCVVLTFVLATKGWHWTAALARIHSQRSLKNSDTICLCL